MNPSRISANQIVQRRLRTAFAFYRCSDKANTSILPISQESQSIPACCSKPNHRQLAENRLEDIAIFERHSRFNSYRLVSLFFSLIYLTIDVVTWSFWDTSSIFSWFHTHFGHNSWVVSRRTLLACGASFSTHKYRILFAFPIPSHTLALQYIDA